MGAVDKRSVVVFVAALTPVSLSCAMGQPSIRSFAQTDAIEHRAPFNRERIARRLDQVLVDAGFNGSFLAVREGEPVLKKGYGFSDPQKTPNTEHTVYDIASLSKSFTAIAVLLLEDSGKLRTTDPIVNYLPNVPADYQDVTIHQLLTHTSGIPRRASAAGVDLPRAVRDYLSMPPSFAAGQKYEYSNGGYALLAAIVEKASASSFERFCRERIFVPAGMTESGFCGESWHRKPVAFGLVSRTGGYRPATPDPYSPLDAFGWEYKGMGGVLSSAHDLIQFVAWVYGGGLPEHVRSKFVTGSRANSQYACGWEVFQFEDGDLGHGHGGQVAGFQSKLWWFPKSRSLIILLSNRDDLSWAVMPKLKQALLDEND